MLQSQVSITAIMTAYCRAYHAMNDDPKIFIDSLAYLLIPEERRTLIEQGFSHACSAQNTNIQSMLQVMGLPNVISRARYAEDSLDESVEKGVRQYVILGAGMDTFAFRRLDMDGKLQIFEVDHPATQSFKRNRIAELNWVVPNNLHFVPVNFNSDSLASAFKGKSYNPKVKSFFSWLGVTMYLTRDEIFTTLRSITDIAPTGSIIVFDYLVPEDQSINKQDAWKKELHKIGEPIKTYFNPLTLPSDLANLSLCLLQDLSPADIQARYFQGQTDSYHASNNVHLAMAVIQ